MTLQMQFQKQNGLPEKTNDFQIPIEDRPTTFVGLLIQQHRKEDSGWFFGYLDSDTWGSFKVTGVTGLPVDGARVAVRGVWEEHPRFGEQFKCLHIRIEDPKQAEHLWLTSGVLKGIGPAIADRILDTWGEKGNSVFDHMNEEDLRKVNGIGPKNVRWILESWEKHQHHAKASSFGLSIGLSLREAKAAYKMWGDAMREHIQQRPYDLSLLPGVGFIRADRIAMGLDHPRKSADRYEAGTREALERASMMGHTGLPTYEIAEGMVGFEGENAWTMVKKLLGNDTDLTYWRGILSEREHDPLRSIEVIRSDVGAKLRVEGREGMSKIVFLALRELYLKEQEIASDVKDLAVRPINPLPYKRAQVDECSKPLTLATQQHEAVYKSLTCGAMILTGGPGTGKTTVLRVILDLLEKVHGLETLCCAPTGKAAQRMKEATGREAMTIHRALDWKGTFQFNRDNKLPFEVVVVDESSMMSTDLAWAVFQAIDKTTRLILVGDADQLPAVGPGQVFRDLIEQGALPTVALTEVHRQAAGSGIIQNAYRLNNGEPILTHGFDDFTFHSGDGEEMIMESVCNWVVHRLIAGGVDPKDILALAPYRRHVALINRKLQERLNGNERHQFGKSFFLSVDDPVIHIRNNYDIGVFNGEIGYITRIYTELDRKLWRETRDSWEDPPPAMIVQFPDREVRYPKQYVSELQLAYAITIHKSQGSEAPVVVLAMPTMYPGFLKRELIYTGLTRAKSRAIIVGDPEVLPQLQRAESRAFRWAWLREFLKDGPT